MCACALISLGGGLMRVNWIIRGLQRVAAFLNSVGSQTTQAQWHRFLKKEVGDLTPAEQTTLRRWIEEDVALGKMTRVQADAALRDAPPPMWRVTLDKAQELRRGIHNDLEFLRSDSPLDRPFDALVDRLNDLQLKMAWRCEPLAPRATRRDPSQAIFKMRWGDGTVERWVAQSWPVTKPLIKNILYAILGKALETGVLGRLKVCRECEKYIVVADVKRRFCSRKCHDEYHNRVTHAENRKHRREAAILKANRLMGAGKSNDVIQEQTELPRRVVEQIRSGDLSPNSQQRPKTATQPKRRVAGLDPTFMSIPLTREQLETIILEEAHRDEVYMQGIRAAQKPSKQKSARKSK